MYGAKPSHSAEPGSVRSRDGHARLFGVPTTLAYMSCFAAGDVT